jgi:glutaconate CoA-transferase subunit A
MVEAEVFDKVVSLDEAIKKFVKDGDTVFAQWQSFAPLAAAHEIIRQKKKNLTLTSAALAHIGDLLIGSGCVKKIITGYVGIELVGLSYCFRRSIEKGIPYKIEVEEYSNFDIQMMNLAATLGLPFIAVRDILGTDYLKKYPEKRRFKVTECPFSGQKVVLLPALAPDIGLIHAQRADSKGNVQCWGAGMEFGTYGSKKLIATVEEICDREIIGRDPDRTIVPSHKVVAIVHEPWGAHPENLYGHYDIDWKWKYMATQSLSTIEGYERFLDEWVYGVSNRSEYIERYVKKYGYKKLESLRPEPYCSIPVNYGLYSGRVI